MLVNRAFADAYLGGGAALGRHLTQPSNSFIRPSEISGIVRDVRDSGLDRAPVPTVYWCWGAAQPGTFFVVRTHGDPRAMAGTIRQKIHELEPSRSVYDIAPLADRISDAYAENRLRTILLTFFALTAVALACVGLYGTLSYMVNLRQREVALRLALGAERGQVVRQFLGQGLRISALGCAAGLALASASTRLLAGMLYGVATTDGTTLGGVVAMVLAISAAASLLPAMRAARVHPAQTLREE
jgi:putative ABC transport system permease protein